MGYMVGAVEALLDALFPCVLSAAFEMFRFLL